nr:hypothetical protein [Nanoarchaeota archaeon]
MSEVFLNNKYLGKVNDGEEFVNQLKSQRRVNKISFGINLFYDEKQTKSLLRPVRGGV